MTLHEQITELCKAILLFENDITPLKEQLFNLQLVTRQLIWNHIVGSTYAKANGQQISSFFGKHGLALGHSDISLIIWQYSSNKDDCLNIHDLWQIFKPLSIKLIEQINAVRQKKASIAKFHEAPYKVSDLLLAIMSKTIIFLRKSQAMKWNIVSAEAEPIIFEPCDSAHLQIYLNKKIPEMILKEVDIVFRHILRSQMACLKNFQEYFIPLGYKGGSLNPNFVRQNQIAQQAHGIQLIKYHAQNVYYITHQVSRSPLYLHNRPLKLGFKSSSKIEAMKQHDNEGKQEVGC